MPVTLSVKGLVETQRKLEQAIADLHGAPMKDGMRKATLLVEGDAKRLAPVDQGLLRASIASELRTEGVGGRDVVGVVGSAKSYAAVMEVGSKPHWPPISALQAWADRHGVSAFVVARAIARRGTKPRLYLQTAFEQNQQKIEDLIGQAVSGIVDKANQ